MGRYSTRNLPEGAINQPGDALQITRWSLERVRVFSELLPDIRPAAVSTMVKADSMGSVGPRELSQWFRAYGPGLLLYARQWLDRSAAEDVVQDVFVRLTGHDVRPGNAKAWLARCVRNAALNRLRSRRRRNGRHARLADSQPEWFDAQPGDVIDAQAAQSAIARLPEALREVVILRIWADMTFREISEALSRPVFTIHRQHSAGLEQIRKAMAQPCPKNPG